MEEAEWAEVATGIHLFGFHKWGYPNNGWFIMEKPYQHVVKVAELTASCQCILRFFQFMSLKYCACHEKAMPGHTKCCTCHAKNICSKMHPFSGNLRPHLLTHLTHVSLVARLPCETHLSRSSSNVPRPPSF